MNYNIWNPLLLPSTPKLNNLGRFSESSPNSRSNSPSIYNTTLSNNLSFSIDYLIKTPSTSFSGLNLNSTPLISNSPQYKRKTTTNPHFRRRIELSREPASQINNFMPTSQVNNFISNNSQSVINITNSSQTTISNNLIDNNQNTNINITNASIIQLPKCRCGSDRHRYVSHSSCPLNKKKKKIVPNQENVNEATQNFLQNLFPPQPSTSEINDFIESVLPINSAQPQVNLEEALSIINENLTENMPIFRAPQCRCGSTEHRRTTYHLCPLNERIRISEINTQGMSNNSSRMCRCGSTTHQRISHADCPLNKKRINNSQSNQLESLDDLNELINTTTNIRRNQRTVDDEDEERLAYLIN
jgi:hypothetical protein